MIVANVYVVVDRVTEVILTGIVCLYSWLLLQILFNSFVFIVMFQLYFDFFENTIKDLGICIEYLSELQYLSDYN